MSCKEKLDYLFGIVLQKSSELKTAYKPFTSSGSISNIPTDELKKQVERARKNHENALAFYTKRGLKPTDEWPEADFEKEYPDNN
ncbi:hypothetical protein JMG10_03455 [Nostoc ellipsosporum NOK]|nr:hypothetical protein [Nostoc ellipsosporum NOK]